MPYMGSLTNSPYMAILPKWSKTMRQIYYASRGFLSARQAGVPLAFAGRAFLAALRIGLEVACCAAFIFGIVLCTIALGG